VSVSFFCENQSLSPPLSPPPVDAVRTLNLKTVQCVHDMAIIFSPPSPPESRSYPSFSVVGVEISPRGLRVLCYFALHLFSFPLNFLVQPR